MILDNDLVVSDAQAVTADAGTTNLIDLGITGRKIGAGEPMALVLFVDVAADGTTTDETYSINIQTDDDVAFGSATTLQTNVKTYAQLIVNSKFAFVIDPNWTFERYVRGYFDVGGTTPTVTGTIALMPLAALRKFTEYANAYTVTH